jgi:DNA-cytosine methyltransferase
MIKFQISILAILYVLALKAVGFFEILSRGIFDGCSGGRLSLVRADKKIDKYYTCEIDKYSSMVTKLNFPDTIALGDITKVNFEMLPKIDFLIGGSPCQDLSFAKGNGKGLEGERSGLFYKYFEAYEVLKRKNPNLQFLLENVKMKKEWKDIISEKLGVQPIFINSADFSAQNRQRLYWTNIPVDEWIPCGDKLQDILETEEDWYVNRDKAYTMTATYSGACPRDYFEKSSRQLAFTDREKSHCIDANYFKGGNLRSYFEKHRRQLVFTRSTSKVVRLDKHKSSSGLICVAALSKTKRWLDDGKNLQWRKLTPLEVERLQTVPERYTKCGQKENGDIVEISNTQRYKMLGNGFTINVIAHIIKNL